MVQCCPQSSSRPFLQSSELGPHTPSPASVIMPRNPMVSEIHTKQSIDEENPVCSWIAFCKKAEGGRNLKSEKSQDYPEKPKWNCNFMNFISVLHCKKSSPPSTDGMSLTKLSLAGSVASLNYSPPGRVWFVTSRLGTGKLLTFFYSVAFITRRAGQ